MLIGRSVLDEFQAQAQAKEVALSFEGNEGETAWCDEQRLVEVLRALVDNAIKYSPSGSSVRLSSRLEENEAVVVVADDGPGITRSELPHVFERFHRGRDERATTAGAGLGLSIARELTGDDGRRHRGGVATGRRCALHGPPATSGGRAPPARLLLTLSAGRPYVSPVASC